MRRIIDQGRFPFAGFSTDTRTTLTDSRLTQNGNASGIARDADVNMPLLSNVSNYLFHS